MRHLIIILIRLYQIIAPKSIRERCIYRESCSEYVINGAKSGGLAEAIRRLRKRFLTCRPGYHLIAKSDQNSITRDLVALSDGSVIEANALNDRTLRELSEIEPPAELNLFQPAIDFK